MAELRKVMAPFGEVNVHPAGRGKLRVRASVLRDPYTDGAQTGIALDGSGSMASLYMLNPAGKSAGGVFAKRSAAENEITPVARKVCAHLARKMDADGGTTVVYWATGPGGGRVEEVGDFTAEQAEAHKFGPPRSFGTGTRLLPAVKHFAERFADAPWGFYAFLTDGALHDLEEVKRYTIELARDIEAGKRNPMKLILVGLGSQVDERQMEELDDLDTGTSVDLWDHKLAAELRVLEQIFAEVVDRNARIAATGQILDDGGHVVKDYGDRGVPAWLDFEIADTAKYFSLSVPGNLVHQSLSDDYAAPASEIVEGQTPPAEKPAVAAPPAADEVEESKDDGLDFDLRTNDETPDIDLD